jgi:hypothetical protein
MIASLSQFIRDNPVLWTGIVSFIVGAIQYIWGAFISALPAPTAQSTTNYQFWFKFFNYLAANVSRAESSHIETSPNFEAAINAVLLKRGSNKVVVQVPEAVEEKKS